MDQPARKGFLETFVDGPSIENWFKWVEWTALTGGLFAACQVIDDKKGFWVLFALGVISTIFCYMAALPPLVRPLFGSGQILTAKTNSENFGYFFVLAGSAIAVILTISTITSIIQAALAA